MKSDRQEKCKECKSLFWTDSIHHDIYCGCCRTEWDIIQKEVKRFTDKEV